MIATLRILAERINDALKDLPTTRHGDTMRRELLGMLLEGLCPECGAVMDGVFCRCNPDLTGYRGPLPTLKQVMDEVLKGHGA